MTISRDTPTTITRDRGVIDNGVVQLRFTDADDTVRDISAQDLAEVLEGLVAFSNEIANSGEYGEGPRPGIRVRVPKEGSFVLEALVWLQENPITGAGLTLGGVASVAAAKEVGTAAGKAMVMALGVGLRKLRGEKPEKSELLASGDVLLTWPDESHSQIRPETWTKLQNMKRPTRKALRKLMAPLGDDANRMEIRSASPEQPTDDILDLPPHAVAGLEEYRSANTEPDDEYEKKRTFETEATLRSIDFESPDRWRVITTKEGTRYAKIDDKEFLRSLNRGVALHKNDIFWLKISEVISKEKGKNASTDWTVLNVTRTKRGERDEES